MCPFSTTCCIVSFRTPSRQVGHPDRGLYVSVGANFSPGFVYSAHAKRRLPYFEFGRAARAKSVGMVAFCKFAVLSPQSVRVVGRRRADGSVGRSERIGDRAGCPTPGGAMLALRAVLRESLLYSVSEIRAECGSERSSENEAYVAAKCCAFPAHRVREMPRPQGSGAPVCGLPAKDGLTKETYAFLPRSPWL